MLLLLLVLLLLLLPLLLPLRPLVVLLTLVVAKYADDKATWNILYTPYSPRATTDMGMVDRSTPSKGMNEQAKTRTEKKAAPCEERGVKVGKRTGLQQTS